MDQMFSDFLVKFAIVSVVLTMDFFVIAKVCHYIFSSLCFRNGVEHSHFDERLCVRRAKPYIIAHVFGGSVPAWACVFM